MKDYRRVTIKRKLPFYHEQQDDLRDWFSDASTAIGAFWEKGGISKSGSGMTIEEEDLLMPEILAVPRTDPNFRRMVAKYFQEINTNIPQEGLELVISLFDDNKELGDKLNDDGDLNLPVNKQHYVTYRHALGHPHTGASQAEAIANPLKKFYIEDLQDIERGKKAKNEEIDKALGEYFNLKKSPKKVDMVLTLLGAKVEIGADPVVILKEQAERKPVTFYKVATDSDMQLKFEISNMVSSGVLDMIKGKYVRTDTMDTLGTEMQTVAWFKDKANSKDVAMFKAMMQEKEV